MTKRRTSTLVLLVVFAASLSLNHLTALADVDDAYTVVLLHCNGSDGGTVFTDESGKSWTANGNAITTTSYSVFGGSSCQFDGTGDYINTADHADFNWTGDFTIDFRVRFRTLPTSGNNSFVYTQYTDANNRINIRLGNTSGTYTWRFVVAVSGTLTVTVDAVHSGIATNTWYHMALVRSGNDYKWFINGTQVGTTVTDSDAHPNLSSDVRLSAYDLTGSYLDGWLDEVRISKGIARWTANFTPPSAEYQPAATQTPTNTPSNTPTQTPSNTPTFTLTPSNTPTASFTPSITLTPSDTPTFTLTPSNTPTASFTPSITLTPSDTPTFTLTPSSTPSTPVMPTWFIDPHISYGEYMQVTVLLALCSVSILFFVVTIVTILVRRKRGIS